MEIHSSLSLLGGTENSTRSVTPVMNSGSMIASASLSGAPWVREEEHAPGGAEPAELRERDGALLLNPGLMFQMCAMEDARRRCRSRIAAHAGNRGSRASLS